MQSNYSVDGSGINPQLQVMTTVQFNAPVIEFGAVTQYEFYGGPIELGPMERNPMGRTSRIGVNTYNIGPLHVTMCNTVCTEYSSL